MKSNSAVVLLFLIFAFLSSCNDSPVSPNQPVTFDSARYNWEKINIPFDISEMHAKDTNDVYMIQYGGRNLITFRNRQFASHSFTDPDFVGTCMTNLNNNIYIGGVNNLTSKPMIQKWNGSNHENIPVPDFGTSLELRDAFTISNEVWFIGYGPHIFRVSGNNVYHYPIDEAYQMLGIASVNGEVYGLALDDDKTGAQYVQRVYKFISGSWTPVFQQTFAGYTEHIYFPLMNPFENQLNAIKYRGDVYNFENADFRKVLYLDSMWIHPSLAGLNINEFTFPGIFGSSFSPGNGSIFNWNGNRMSIELRAYQSGQTFNINYKNNSYIILSSTASMSYANTLHIGKKN